MLDTRVSCSKMAQLIKMRFEGLTHIGPRSHVLDDGQVQMNPFAAAKGDKVAMWPVANLLWTLVLDIINVVSVCEEVIQ